MFELSQIRCFVTAAEELHFGRAAARLNMTQPPLSRQIQVLERILGVPLFERTSRSVKLTPAGRVFLPEARRIVWLAESATLAARKVAQGDAGRIGIGFTAVSGYSFLPQIVAQARARLPNIELDLREMVSNQQVEALQTGLIDIGFLRQPLERNEFESERVVSEGLVAALPTGDARLTEPELTLKAFDGSPLIMYSREGASYFHNMLLSLFAEAKVTPDYVQQVTQIHSMLGLVRAGLGIAIVPRTAMSLQFSDVHYRDIATTPATPVELYMVWRRGNSNPALTPVRTLCAEVAPKTV
ncbi:LysR family transcriptional regulator [Asticcacaulis machinosus]|uniref:LysR family transcriptional regulator n=1 Tax=Asticcacaulis machinosus TaxID=2984211 RepID=A0ABT5HLV7_9CAUL|nr:LysR family transcriptional regulator [Asticcacaulis machinosus]MDC7677220.1 LysR family transcriptional regulator [Asticcacaulis machinosus]